MKLLIKTSAILAAIFASTYILIHMSGWITMEEVEELIRGIRGLPGTTLGLAVTGLLFVDIFIAIPTLSVITLGGYLIGFPWALLYVITGLLSATLAGYWISLKWGDGLLSFIEKDEASKERMRRLFQDYGITILILSRALPILPEVTACLAGITKMPVKRLMTGWALGTLPYALIATYSGSISDVNNPYPAIMGALVLSGALWLSWFVVMRGRATLGESLTKKGRVSDHGSKK